MINRHERDKLALAVRRYLSKQIDNFELDDIIFEDYNGEDDRGVLEIQHQLWYLYDDFKSHKAKGKYALSNEEHQRCLRCILFLQGDLDYSWPDYPSSLLGSFLNIFTFGWYYKYLLIAYKKHGNYDVWPFINEHDFSNAKLNSRFFTGNSKNLTGP